MKDEHGTYTRATNIVSQAGWQAFSHYKSSSKILPCNVVDGRKCTFRLLDDSEVTIALYSGVIVPVVTKGCKFEDTVLEGEIITLLDYYEADGISPTPVPTPVPDPTPVPTPAPETSVVSGDSVTSPTGETITTTTIFDPSSDTNTWSNNTGDIISITLPGDFPGGIIIYSDGSNSQVSANLAGQSYDLPDGSMLMSSDPVIPAGNPSLDVNTTNYGAPNSAWTAYLGGASSKNITGNVTAANGTFNLLSWVTGENVMVSGNDPYGRTAALWRAVDVDTTSNNEGGFDFYGYNGIADANKSYMYVTFIKKLIDNTNGASHMYHGSGPRANGIDSLNGNLNTNPYFSYGGISNLPLGIWCASIGIVHAQTATEADAMNLAGVYRMDTQQRIFGFTHNDFCDDTLAGGEFKWSGNDTRHSTRNYHYYGGNTASGNALEFYGMGIFELTATGPQPGDIVSQAYVID